MRWIMVSVVVLVLAFGSAGRASANLITNGGFETGTFTGWTTTPAASGSIFGVAAFQPHTGTFAVFFGAISPPDMDSISQTLVTVPGQSYTIHYWLDNNNSPSNRFLVQWGATTLSDIVDFAPFPYTEFTFTATAPGASTVLRFSSYQVPGQFVLDDVSVDPVATPVPVLSSVGQALVVVVVGGSGLLFLRRRRSLGG